MGIEDLQNPPPSGVINRAPLHRHEPGIKQMTQHLGHRLDLPGAIAAKYQRTVQTSSLNTLGHRLQRKEAIGPADGELISGFGHRSIATIPELSAQTPRIARQADVAVLAPVQEPTQTFRIRRSPGGQAIATASAGPLNPPILGDFESGSMARSPQNWGLGGDTQAKTIVQRKVASDVQTKVPSPVQETTTQPFRIRRSPQGVTADQTIATASTGPLNPPILGDFEPGSTARSPQNWGLGGDSITPPQAEAIVQRKVQTQVQPTAQPGVSSEVQTTTPTLVQTIVQTPTSLQRSPTSPQPLKLHRQPQEDEIKRYAINQSPSEVLSPTATESQTPLALAPNNAEKSEPEVIQRQIEGSPLVLYSRAIVQRVDAVDSVPSAQSQIISANQPIPPPTQSEQPSPDMTGLVDHISRIMARQLAVERERRGL
jgi:hypothetical protein